MSSVSEHYAKHLAPVYAWMAGGVETALRRGSAELDELGLTPKGSARAVDLGAGFGMHAIPLARRGFSVLAVDTSTELLGELAAHAAGLRMRTAVADLLAFRALAVGPSELILCMGDTITHLPSREVVESLLSEVATALDPGGTFVLTFRDYSAAAANERRFVPVRSDADRILTCCLEFDEAGLTVHDLLHERLGAEWRLSVSAYRKLRIAPDWLVAGLEKLGFQVRREAGPGGMVRLVAQRGITPQGPPVRA